MRLLACGVGVTKQNVNPILEAGGVDVVIAGHSHTYERSYLIDGAYGTSSTVLACNKVNATTGSAAAPYIKPAGITPHAGAVYVVAGTSGSTTSTSSVPKNPVVVRTCGACRACVPMELKLWGVRQGSSGRCGTLPAQSCK